MKKISAILLIFLCSPELSVAKNDFIAKNSNSSTASEETQQAVSTSAPEKNEFIVTKKKQRPSTSRLKEEIGEGYERMLKQQATIIERMAQANRMLVDRTRELLDDECCATLAQLQQHKDELNMFAKTLNKFESEACSMLDCLHTGLPVRSDKKNQNKKDLAQA